MNELPRDNRAAWWLVGFGLIASIWLAYYPLPFFTFYKEWIFAMAVVLAALALGKGTGAGTGLFRHPLTIAAMGVLLVLLLQSLVRVGVWRQAVPMGGYLVFFVMALETGRRMRRARPDRSLVWLCAFLLVAALGNCFFAALQLNSIDLDWPLVAPRAGSRVAGNLAQANHFADLLWLASLAAVYLHVRGRVSATAAVMMVLTLQLFSQFSGSRMVWLYAALALILGAILRLRGSESPVRRFAAGLVALSCSYALVAGMVSVSGASEWFGVSSGAERVASGSAGTTQLRLWFWRAGIDAARSEPLLGVGAGRYVGHAHELAMKVEDSPAAAADANAHNLIIHLAAELGVPLAIFVALCLLVWLVQALRRSGRDLDSLAALTLAGVIVVHANLEYPLWYTYFLGLLGLFAGHVEAPSAAPDAAPARAAAFGAVVPVLMLAVAALAYQHFRHLELAMQRVVFQVGMGAPPQPDAEMERALAAVPSWSPYADYAEAIRLITSLPDKDNAAGLSERCNRAVVTGPSPYLLARCATAFQVAGDAQRASYFANSLCKLYPAADLTLIQSMTYVERTSAQAGQIVSTCVERR